MISLIAKSWFPVKSATSRFVSLFYLDKRRKLLRFSDFRGLATYMANNLKYVADPLSGAIDYYTHPEHVQYMIETGYKGSPFSCDCDDYAIFAHANLKAMGYRPTVYTVLDGGITWSHVICVFQADGKYWMLDTNGLNEVGEFSDKGIMEQAVLNLLGAIYSEALYIDIIEITYPF